MKIGTLVQNTYNAKFGIIVGLDNRHRNLVEVASDLGIGWVRRYLEVTANKNKTDTLVLYNIHNKLQY